MTYRLAGMTLLGAALTVIAPAQAQQYPSKPIRLLIPTAAGGGPDTIGRAIGQSLSESFGQTVVVDNRPGASGAIAMEVGKLAAPDGYTLNVFSVSQIIRPLLFRVPYDLERDFAPISQLSAQSYVLMTTLSLPVKSVPELLAHARANPGKLNFASVGQGSQIHLMTELFRSMTRIQVVHVPYKGIAAAYPDLFAGTIHFTFAGIISAQTHVKAQRVRALAVSGPTRMKALPDLPTVAEAGVPGFAVTQWYGLLAPAGTPRQTVEFLNKAVRRALQQPEVAGRIAAEGSEAVGSTPQQLAARIKAERAKWTKVIKEAGIKGEE
jgi:tripartite-type tricarboxylate transporter receptor subunit TctC